MPKLQINVIKVLARGCNYRFMTVEVPNSDIVKTIRISNEFYWVLRDAGVPTAQKLYRIKQKNNK